MVSGYKSLDDDVEEILFKREVIEKKIDELAGRILDDYKGKELIWLTVMKGANIFSEKLKRRVVGLSYDNYGGLVVDLIQDIVIISLFSNPDNPRDIPATILGPDPAISYQGRPVLIVEDIVDRGLTMKYILDHIGKHEPEEMKLCSLLSKPSQRQVPGVEINYLGFEVPTKFVVGFGLDFEQRYRDLPYIGVLKREVYAPKE